MDQYKKASVGKRIGAFLIDHFIFSYVILLPFFLFAKDFASFENFYIFMPVVMLIALIVYALKDSINGRSIGKRILGLYTRDCVNLEKTPDLIKLIIRNLLVFVWPVEFFILIKDKDGRRLGDKLAKTQVVEKNNFI